MTDQQPTNGTGAAASDWADLAGQPTTPASLLALAGADPTTMTGPALIDAIVASEKALSQLTGTQMRFLTALAVPFTAGDPTRLAAQLARKSCITGDDDPDQVTHYLPQAAAALAAAEVAAALRIPSRTAHLRVQEADTMTGVLAPTLHALEHGELDRVKARVIAEHCQPLTPEQTQDLQDLVLPRVDDLTTSELRDAAGHAVIIVDPDGAEHRHHQAAARRELAMTAQPDGMATLKAHLPADGAVKIFQVTDLLATGTAGTPGDSRGISARRVDALIDIADHLLTQGFVDLTDYLGQELPDHSTPTTKERTHPTTTTTSSSSSTDTASSNTASTSSRPASTGPTNPSSAPGGSPPDGGSTSTDPASTDTTDSSDATGDVDSTKIPADTETAAPELGTTDNDQPASTDTPDSADPAHTPATADDADTADTRATPDPAETANTPTTAKGPAARRGGNRVFTRQGRRPHLSVTIALSTLAGLDNLPGTLAGFGAIPAGLARSIAASAATINALITDPDTGVATAAGALTYRPTQELRDQIAALLGVCQFPSCRQPAWRCDLDHRETFNHHHPEHGGKTTDHNIGPFCRRHHLMKHHTAWRMKINPTRTIIEWTSPTGHTYRKQGRQAAVPGMWVSTAATAVAERLDHITKTPNPPSSLLLHRDNSNGRDNNGNNRSDNAGQNNKGRHNDDTDRDNNGSNNSDNNESDYNDRDKPGNTNPGSDRSSTPPTSHIEDLLAAILIRHHLNTKPIEIDYQPDTFWKSTELDDPPPF